MKSLLILNPSSPAQRNYQYQCLLSSCIFYASTGEHTRHVFWVEPERWYIILCSAPPFENYPHGYIKSACCVTYGYPRVFNQLPADGRCYTPPPENYPHWYIKSAGCVTYGYPRVFNQLPADGQLDASSRSLLLAIAMLR